MTRHWTAALCLAVLLPVHALTADRLKQDASPAGVRPDIAPADCPFPKSPMFGGIEFTGRHAEYTQADTWYPSWASDNKMYSPWTDGDNTIREYNTYILESASVTGPWKLVQYLHHFGKQAYFVNIPSKFISADGRTVWLCYSANWNHRNKEEWIDPPGSKYSLCLQEIRLPTNQKAEGK